MEIRPYRDGDAPAWVALRCRLWPEGSEAEHAREVGGFLALPDRMAVRFAVDDAGGIVGFVEVSMTDDPHALPPAPAGRVEGWYVAPALRRRGVGRALVDAAATWAREQGAKLLLSDAELDNEVSHAAHRALGFAEVVRLVMYRREL